MAPRRLTGQGTILESLLSWLLPFSLARFTLTMRCCLYREHIVPLRTSSVDFFYNNIVDCELFKPVACRLPFVHMAGWLERGAILVLATAVLTHAPYGGLVQLQTTTFDTSEFIPLLMLLGNKRVLSTLPHVLMHESTKV